MFSLSLWLTIISMLVGFIWIAKKFFYVGKKKSTKVNVRKDPVIKVDISLREDNFSKKLNVDQNIKSKHEEPFLDNVCIEDVVAVDPGEECLDHNIFCLGIDSHQSSFDDSVVNNKKDMLCDNFSCEENEAILQKDNLSKTYKDYIAFTIIAKKDRPYIGYELLQSLFASGFRYGEMNIFHRHENMDGSGDILFSLANAFSPGVFDLSDVGAISCAGLAIFMPIDESSRALKALDCMIDTAKQLVEELGGDIYDEENNLLDQDSIFLWKDNIKKMISAH